jgi:hypothetical protein
MGEESLEDLEGYRLHFVRARDSLNNKITEIEQRMGAMATGISIGDTISYDFGSPPRRRRGKVVGFERHAFKQWALHITSIRKDKSDGAQLTIYPYANYRKETTE